MRLTSAGLRTVLVAGSLIALNLAENARAGYMFTIGPFNKDYNVAVWFTTGGTRIGDPLFEGLLPAGTSIPRSTKDANIDDHSTKITAVGATKVSWNDTFFQNSPLVAVTTPTVVPFLDSEANGVNVFFIINASQWIAGGGSFSPGETYSDFNNGTNPLLPGFTVGYSTNSNLSIEDAFTINTATGSVSFNQALPLGSAQGSLTAAGQMALAVPEPRSVVLLGIGALGVIGFASRRLHVGSSRTS